MTADTKKIIVETNAWVSRAVIGLNLCPFAKAAQVKNQMRYVVSDAKDTDQLLTALCEELHLLADAAPEQVETTLLIHPYVLTDFLDYNDFLDVVDAALEELEYDGVIQVASFHPQYQFADTDADDVTNATNRSPYPTLHLLREDSIDKAVEAFPEADKIFDANMNTLKILGTEGWKALQEQCKKDAESE
jgi:uncharacterized protein